MPGDDSQGPSRRALLRSLAGTPLLFGSLTAASTRGSTLDAGTATLQRVEVPAGDLETVLIPGNTSAGIPLAPTSHSTRYEQSDYERSAAQLLQVDTETLLRMSRAGWDKLGPGYSPDDTAIYGFMLQQAMSVDRVNYFAPPEQRWYRSLPPGEKFTLGDGTRVEHPEGMAGRTYTDDPHTVYGDPIPSVFAAPTEDFLTTPVTERFERGYSIAFFDQTNIVPRQGLDFSDPARSAFQDHLTGLPAARLDDLGIDDPGSFDMRRYIEANGLVDAAAPAEDPVFREYFLHQHRAVRSLWNAVTDRLHDTDHPADTISTFPNLGTGPNLGSGPAASVYSADAFDVAAFQLFGTPPSVPPDPIQDYRYRLFHAAGRFDRPAMLVDTDISAEMAERIGLDPDTRYTTLLRLQAAEAYALGQRQALFLFPCAGPDCDVAGNASNWLDADGSAPTALQSFTDFVLAHRRFLADVSQANRVAVVFSLPTVLWNDVPQRGWGSGVSPQPFLDSFIGSTALLRDNQIPHDVVIFDQPDLWSAPEQRDRLSRYDTVVLPRMDAISDAQVETLESILDAGVSVIVSGEPPTRDAFYEPRTDAAQLLRDHDRATVLEEDPARGYHRNGTGGGPLVDAFDASTTRQLELDVDSRVGTNVLIDEGSEHVAVHLINYDYDRTTDSTATKREFELTVRDLPFDPSVARWYAPDSSTDLDLRDTDGGYTVTVPELDVWGFAVFARAEGALTSGDEATASAAVDEAETAVEDARAAERTRELFQAERSVSNARSSLSHGAYEEATTWANRATEEADAAYRRPVVGVDVAHGQAASGTGYEFASAVREEFQRFDYVRVSDWSADTLEQVDVLLVPPALAGKGSAYGFDGAELDRLEAFVDRGGSVWVLGRSGLDPGVNELLDRFGFEIDADGGIQSKRPYVDAHPLEALHPLTKVLTIVRMQAGVSLTAVPDAADVLARVPAGTDAWLHETDPVGERNSGEASAADAPVYAVRSYGDGLVSVLGTIAPLTVSNDPHVKLVWNALSVLGRHARANRDPDRAGTSTPESDTPTASATPTSTARTETSPRSTTSETPSDTTPTSSPGFGFGIAGGAVGTAALLKWCLSESRDE